MAPKAMRVEMADCRGRELGLALPYDRVSNQPLDKYIFEQL